MYGTASVKLLPPKLLSVVSALTLADNVMSLDGPVGRIDRMHFKSYCGGRAGTVNRI